MSEHDTTVNLDAAGYNEPARVNWRKQVESRLDDGAATMKQLKQDLQANTEATNAVKADTGEVIALLKSFQGAMKVLNMLGKLAKPLSYIVMFSTAIYSFYIAVKAGVARATPTKCGALNQWPRCWDMTSRGALIR